MQIPIAVYLARANTRWQLELKTKVWIVSNVSVLRSLVLIGIRFHTALQLPVIVQLMCVPYHMLKAIVPDSLWRNVEISAQALCSTMGSCLGLIFVVFWTHCFLLWKETELYLCMWYLSLPSVPRKRAVVLIYLPVSEQELFNFLSSWAEGTLL